MPSALVTTTEFDLEVTLRTQGDSRLAAFVGLPLSSGIPGNTLPSYSTQGAGSPVELTDNDSLTLAAAKLDAGKNSKQTWYEVAQSVAANPRNIRFDEIFSLVATTSTDVFITIDGEVVQGRVESQRVLPLTEELTLFPTGQFACGGRVTYVTVTKGTGTYRVVAGVELVGRRGIIVPRIAVVTDLALKRKLVFNYTGTDQTFTILPGETQIVVKAWGAGGGGEIRGLNPTKAGANGGSGGYTWGNFIVDSGDDFAVVVGRGVQNMGSASAVYGFGGPCLNPASANPSTDTTRNNSISYPPVGLTALDWHDHTNGGGMSGLFTGTGAVLSSDDSRALVIAGGGGGGSLWGVDDVTARIGGHGNAPNAGGMLDFLGQVANSGSASGGGGYRGGVTAAQVFTGSDGGKGGSGFLANSAVDGAIQYLTGGAANAVFSGTSYATGQNPPPGAGDTDYVIGTGGTSQPGCVVVLIYGP